MQASLEHSSVIRRFYRTIGSRSRPLTSVGRVIVCGAAVALGATIVSYIVGLRLNLTGSIPPGVYVVTQEPIARRTIVMACLPSMASAFARSRGFVPSGYCHDGSAPIGKTVAAIAGDTVDVTPVGIAVNGRLLPNSRALTVDSEDRPLRAFPFGRFLVGSDQVWLVSSYSSRSFDSRYFGPVPIDGIITSIRPVFVAR
ncbi:MAG: conjugative transfer signal peptidase TraF [Gemmatimonadaceae bacterium]